MAQKLLEHNRINRPLRQYHINRIRRLIEAGRWRFNGDTIKVSVSRDVLDGQHRLWAIFLSGTACYCIVVYGIEREAFSTIDTMRQQRTFSDVLALSLGSEAKYRSHLGTAYAWLLRFQRNAVEHYRDPENRIENDDIEQVHAEHPAMITAVARAMKLRELGPPGVVGFVYYIIANRDQALAERMMETLEDPAGVAVNDPFFRLRSYLTAARPKRRDALPLIAITFKAANAAHAGKRVENLRWNNLGKKPEAFPTLEF